MSHVVPTRDSDKSYRLWEIYVIITAGLKHSKYTTFSKTKSKLQFYIHFNRTDLSSRNCKLAVPLCQLSSSMGLWTCKFSIWVVDLFIWNVRVIGAFRTNLKLAVFDLECLVDLGVNRVCLWLFQTVWNCCKLLLILIISCTKELNCKSILNASYNL